jgi:broad specificity phosphatase PhoE
MKGMKQMKIGLVRHYKVKKGFPKGMSLTANELNQWFEEYNTSDIEIGDTLIDTKDWDICYSSDLSRAKKTAEHLYDDNIIFLPELRELNPPLFKGNIKLPFFVWVLAARIRGLFDPKVKKEIKEGKKRITSFFDKIPSSQQSILIVGHGGMMMYMRKELIKRGYKGPYFTIPKNGEVYVFKKER